MDGVLITGYKLFKLDCSSREKTQFCIMGYAMRLVRAPSHCSSQLQSGIVGNLTKNYSSQQGPRAQWKNPWNILLLIYLIYLLIYWAQARAGAGFWIACGGTVASRHSPALYYSNSYLATQPCTHTLTTVWLPFGPHSRHVYLKCKKTYFIANSTPIVISTCLVFILGEIKNLIATNAHLL